jgi:hypothetical protein
MSDSRVWVERFMCLSLVWMFGLVALLALVWGMWPFAVCPMIAALAAGVEAWRVGDE